MTLTNDSYTRIAEKYSDSPMNSDQDVEKFYRNMQNNYSEKEIIDIMKELTKDIYNNSQFDIHDDYPDVGEYRQINDKAEGIEKIIK